MQDAPAPADDEALQPAFVALQPAAGTDADAALIVAYLDEFADVPHTQRSYRKELVRFRLWCRLLAGRRFAELTRSDVQRWQRFLAAPPPAWIGPRQARLGSPQWRPFEGPLSPASCRQALVIVGGFYGYLQRCRHLDHNPFLVLRRRGATRHEPPAPARVLARATIGRILDVLTADADAAHGRHRDEAERRLFAVRFLANAGLRRTEFAAARMEDLQTLADAADGGGQCFLNVRGKGGRLRRVALNDAALAALTRWRAHLQAAHGLDPRSGPLLVGRLRGPDRPPAPASDGIVYRLVKTALAGAARALAGELPTEAARLLLASPHWLRHSYATAAANADVPLEFVRDQLGHVSLDTTLLYRHREDVDRARRLRQVTL